MRTNTWRAHLLSASVPRALTQPLSLHVLACAEGPASLSRGRLTNPAAHVALDGLRRLWRRPGHRCSLTRCGCDAATHQGPLRHQERAAGTALLPGSRRLPPRPTSCPACEGIPLGPASRCLRPPRALHPGSRTEGSHRSVPGRWRSPPHRRTPSLAHASRGRPAVPVSGDVAMRRRSQGR